MSVEDRVIVDDRNPATTDSGTTEKAFSKEEIASAKEQRTRELEESFTYNGYQVVRKELFAHLRDPAVTIRKDSITFNTACIDGLEDVVYVHVMFNEELKRIVVEGCEENDKDALRWCVNKPDKRKSRKMTCRPFSDLVYDAMGWESDCRYKVLGYRIQFEGKTLYIFDLLVPEIFHEAKKRKKKADGTLEQNTETPVDTRKGFYPENIAGSFGVPVEEHRKEAEVTETDGYVSMAMLTGKKTVSSGSVENVTTGYDVSSEHNTVSTEPRQQSMF